MQARLSQLANKVLNLFSKPLVSHFAQPTRSTKELYEPTAFPLLPTSH